ncbi:VCBS domain-containing protein, partial [Cloacibacillus porcorum]
MAKQIVTKAEGEVYRLEANGSKIKLQTGDLVETGTRIITETGASVRFEDENGIPMELGENSGAVLFSNVLIEQGDTLFAMDTEAAEEPAAEEPQDGEEEQPLPSDSESGSDTVSEMHSFVEMTRTEYGGDINLSYARDVNVTREIEGRASLNPRIEYDYNVSIIQEVKSYEDPRFPFDGGGRGGEESRFEPVRPAADTIPMPETTGTAAVTDEDVPVVIDPLENFVIPSGLQLAVTGASAQYGTVQIIDGKIAYQPNADYHGGDKITVTVTDQAGRTYESEVDVTVSPVVDTVDDSDSVAEHASVDTNVLANDKFADLPGAKVTDVTQGQYGEVTINEDGTVKYIPKTDWLAEGETLTDTYQYTVTTAAGNTETATVTITITGTNDAPTSADNYGSAVEDHRTETDQSHETSNGNILDNDSDPDHGAQLFVKAVGGDESNVGTEIDGKYGKITINEDGTYTYKLNNGNPNVQALRVGEEITDEVFHITVKDEYGAAAPDQTLTIKIIGTNDKPKIERLDKNSDSDSANLTESNAGLTESGHLTLTDVDIKDTVSTKLESVDIDHDNSTYQGDLPEGLDLNALQGMLNLSNGTIANDSNTGTINWTFNSSSETFNFLGEGETLVLKYQIKSTDDSGSDNDSDSHTITVTITGTNDAPVISLGDGDSTDGGVRETDSGGLTVSDTLTVTD